MPYKITFTDEKIFLRVKAEGEQTFEDNIDLAEKTAAEAFPKKYQRVLVDIRGFTGQPGIGFDYEYAKFISRLIENKITKIAVIYKPSSEEFTKFFETASKNRGMNLNAFTDEKQAEEWINGTE
ncbi:MAG TPA: hypothetical protein ENN55_02945 [Firmicutes bacterium]|nr:hypothetical protein [Bacillota bacterium]